MLTSVTHSMSYFETYCEPPPILQTLKKVGSVYFRPTYAHTKQQYFCNALHCPNNNHESNHPTQLFWASFIVCGGSFINGTYPGQLLTLGRDRVTIKSFFQHKCCEN